MLETVVLQNIRYHAKLLEKDEKKVISEIYKLQNQSNEETLKQYRTNINSEKARLQEIDALFPKLFEEKQKGNISDAVFKKMMIDYESEQQNISSKIESLEDKLQKSENRKNEIPQWTDAMKKYSTISVLNREVVLELIDSITVSEQYVKDGVKQQDIKINYRFVGNMDRTRIADISTKQKVQNLC